MMLVTNAIDMPDDERYHTLRIKYDDESGQYNVFASNNRTAVSVEVGSVAFGSDAMPAIAGFVKGDAEFDTGEPQIELRYVDFDEYEYDEIQVVFNE